MRHVQGGRTSFVLLVLGLLGGGLVCLLVVNTTLAANSIEIAALQQANAASAQRAQDLRQQVATGRSASVLEKEAWRLGMRPDPMLSFVDVRTGRIGVPGSGVTGLALGQGAAGTAGAGRTGRGGAGHAAGHAAGHPRGATPGPGR